VKSSDIKSFFREICGLSDTLQNGEDRNTYGVLVGKPQGKRPLERPRLRWEDTKLTLEKQEGRVLTGSIWVKIDTKWRAVVNTAKTLRKEISVSHDAGYCVTSSGAISFSKRNLLHGVS
jgi:hypothetical protein